MLLSRTVCVLLVAAAALPFAAGAATDEKLPTRGPIAPYLMSSPQAEIALARSGGPRSIAAKASVLVLTPKGFVTAVKGSNGWVCLVERSWNSGFNDTEFWNPAERGPDCLNPPAVSTEIPQQIAQSQWVMAGLTREQIEQKTNAAFADGTFKRPLPNAFGFMLSKLGHLNHARGGPWRPHMMFFVRKDQLADYAGNAPDSPVGTADRGPYESAMVYVPLTKWSDGSPAPR
jgi:hypothetical protein